MLHFPFVIVDFFDLYRKTFADDRIEIFSF